MLCSNCSSKEASFHYKYIKNGVKNEIHLCTDCAAKLGYINDAELSFNPANIFGEFFSLPHFIQHKNPVANCPDCGTSFDTIRKSGFVGCDKCYEFFANPIENILSKIQLSTVHKGALKGTEGKKIERDNTLKSMKEKLQRAILDENYEEAAVLRDKIKAIESEGGEE
jgi:protein arginine kinase activator